jgi:hypothetical protein
MLKARVNSVEFKNLKNQEKLAANQTINLLRLKADDEIWASSDNDNNDTEFVTSDS